MNPFLSKSPAKTAIYTALVVFLAYTLIFGLRKAYTVATFEGLTVAGYSYKTLLVITQMLGYLLAKAYGITYISALQRKGRGKVILLLCGFAWLCWLLFALVPKPYNLVFLFLNGFPLGMLWGVVFSYVEGRRTTDFIGAALAVSFIFASGFVKSVGSWLMLQWSITEFWMPFCVGLTFAVPLLVLVYLMEKIPPPNEEDIRLRMERTPMSAQDRRYFLKEFSIGIFIAILIYTFATVFRDIRDNFSAEMWKEMGYAGQPAIFTRTEVPITLIALVLIGSMMFIKNSFRAFKVAHYFILLGFVFAGGSTLLFHYNGLQPIAWMTLVGLGLYMVYIPFNAVFFERFISSFRSAGNVGFLIYIADTFAYTGSIGVMLSKEIAGIQLHWVDFFKQSVVILSAAGAMLSLFSLYYFKKKYQKQLLKRE